jgi:hypothetical protein
VELCSILWFSPWYSSNHNYYLFLIQKPIVPSALYRAIWDTLLVGLTGYSKQVRWSDRYFSFSNFCDMLLLIPFAPSVGIFYLVLTHLHKWSSFLSSFHPQYWERFLLYALIRAPLLFFCRDNLFMHLVLVSAPLIRLR